MSLSSRQKCLDYIKACNDKYNYHLIFVVPENISYFNNMRNPSVVIYKMVEALPSGQEYDKYALGLANLAYESNIVQIVDILDGWWIPVTTNGIRDVIGEIDSDWKKELISIWMDSNVKQTVL
jgi:hypothetical protein